MVYVSLLHRRSQNHKMNCKLVQPVCTDITRSLECMHRFRVGRPNLILRATNTRISDQMRSPRMIFGRIWRPGDRPFPALLNKGMKGCANVFKCGRRAEAPMEKEPQQTCFICRQKGSISSSEVSETMICCRK